MLVTRIVSGSYFDTVGTPLRSGRTFRDTDKGSPRVAIVSESMAKYYFPQIDPIGRRFGVKISLPRSSGLGEWTEEAFVAALRTGKRQGQPNGRAILPPMPLGHLPAPERRGYEGRLGVLRSIPPVKNPVPLPIPPQADAVPTAGSK